jgi:heme/copper-type cytochrome/quinol oxidase subunit 2
MATTELPLPALPEAHDEESGGIVDYLTTVDHKKIGILYMVTAFTIFLAGGVLALLVRAELAEQGLQLMGENTYNQVFTMHGTLMIFLFAATIQAQNKVLDPVAQPAVKVTVTGFQWSWRFTYEGTGAEVIGTPERVPELVLPVGQTVRVKLESADVVHSFYVPQTLFKRQAIPGITSEFDLTFEKVGLYHGACVQFCGLQHTDMVFRVRVLSQGEYQSWLAAARRGAAGQPGT